MISPSSSGWDSMLGLGSIPAWGTKIPQACSVAKIIKTIIIIVISSSRHKKTGFPSGFKGKESTSHAGATGNTGLIPGSERSPGGAHSKPLQSSCLENLTDWGAWWANSPWGHKESDKWNSLAQHGTSRQLKKKRGCWVRVPWWLRW